MIFMDNPFGQVSYLHISSEFAGQRIDNFLHTHLKGVPKSHVYRILRKGEVRINKGRVQPTYRLQENDVLRLPPIRQTTENNPVIHKDNLHYLSQSILYEDKHLFIINKPAGIAVHGGSGVSFGVIEGLRALYPQLSLELVHRLDRETSGCLMISKKRSILKQLHQQLQTGNIQKHYLALVQGQWNPQMKEVDLPLLKNVVQSGERIVRVDQNGKPAHTQIFIEKSFKDATLLRLHPTTGRTHQIRVHTAHFKHPIAGDEKYGDEPFNHFMRQNYELKRLFLHALHLSFYLPEIDYSLAIDAPLPPALETVLKKL
jgi:23S rRNA pseudouridine955/2504/2580 synthase